MSGRGNPLPLEGLVGFRFENFGDVDRLVVTVVDAKPLTVSVAFTGSSSSASANSAHPNPVQAVGIEKRFPMPEIFLGSA